MNVLIRLEKLVESLIESPFARLFKTRLHPADLARSLTMALEQAVIDDGRGGILAPNAYRIYLNPDDFDNLRGRTDIEAEAESIKRYLIGLLAESGGRVVGDVQVTIAAKELADSQAIKIVAEHLTPADTVETHINTGSTKQYRQLVPVTADAWQLQLPDRLVNLGMPIVRLGRALNNDLVISEQSVSRYHAQLRWLNGAYHVQNLSRSQPLFLNDTPVDRSRPLKSGDVLTLGRAKIHVGISR